MSIKVVDCGRSAKRRGALHGSIINRAVAKNCVALNGASVVCGLWKIRANAAKRTKTLHDPCYAVQRGVGKTGVYSDGAVVVTRVAEVSVSNDLCALLDVASPLELCRLGARHHEDTVTTRL